MVLDRTALRLANPGSQSNTRSVVSPDVQPHELENLRRSLAMLNPGVTASLSREDAMRLIVEVADLQARLERLRVGLRQLVDEAGGH